VALGLIASAAQAQRPQETPAGSPSPAPASSHPAAEQRPTVARPDVVTGLVQDASGQPVAGARVAVVYEQRVAPGFIARQCAVCHAETKRAQPVFADFDSDALAALVLDRSASMDAAPCSPGLTQLGVLVQARTDRQGRFRLDLKPKAAKVKAPPPNSCSTERLHLLAAAPGHGLQGQPLDGKQARQDVVLRLPAEQALRGRLIDLQGGPAAGVRCQVVRVTLGGKDGPDLPGAVLDDFGYWPSVLTTDRTGRVALRGLGGGARVVVEVADDRFARAQLPLPADAKDPAREGTHVLSPSQLIEGVVVAADTGKPLSGARVFVEPTHSYTATVALMLADGFVNRHPKRGPARININSLHELITEEHTFTRTSVALRSIMLADRGVEHLPPVEVRTDERGRFRLNPYLESSYNVVALPPEGASYLGKRTSIQWPRGAARQQVQFALAPGVKVRGKAVEAGSDKPVAAASVRFFRAADDQAAGGPPRDGLLFARTVETDRDGAFQAIVPPGTWNVLVVAPGEEFVYQKVAATEFARDEAARQQLFNYPDAWTTVRLKSGSVPADLTLRLRRAAIRGRVVGPDGRPVATARLFHSRELPTPTRAQPVPVRDGAFELPINYLEETYPLYIFDEAANLGGVLKVAGKQAEAGPVTVQLAPCGTATARCLDREGQPLAGYRPLLWCLLDPGPHDRPRDFEVYLKEKMRSNFAVWAGDAAPKHYGDGPRTDAQGRITFPALIPGATYRVYLADGKWHDFTAVSGRAVELPDLTIREPERGRRLPVIRSDQ
jgi:protocatechuate 3,4-dioxygenase beta subunit